jgi:hypothetical protein
VGEATLVALKWRDDLRWVVFDATKLYSSKGGEGQLKLEHVGEATSTA